MHFQFDIYITYELQHSSRSALQYSITFCFFVNSNRAKELAHRVMSEPNRHHKLLKKERF